MTAISGSSPFSNDPKISSGSSQPPSRPSIKRRNSYAGPLLDPSAIEPLSPITPEDPLSSAKPGSVSPISLRSLDINEQQQKTQSCADQTFTPKADKDVPTVPSSITPKSAADTPSTAGARKFTFSTNRGAATQQYYSLPPLLPVDETPDPAILLPPPTPETVIRPELYGAITEEEVSEEDANSRCCESKCRCIIS